MGRHRLNGVKQTVPSLAVVAVCDDSGAISHVGILKDSQVVSGHSCVSEVHHQAPPLGIAGQSPSSQCVLVWHAAAWFDLTPQEYRRARLWIDRILVNSPLNRSPRTYIVQPCYRIDDANSRSKRCDRFSCAGFVIALYSHIEKPILDLDQIDLFPEIDYDRLVLLWPSIAKQSSDRLTQIGLGGEGPWRIVLPGYVLNAVADSCMAGHVPSGLHENTIQF